MKSATAPDPDLPMDPDDLESLWVDVNSVFINAAGRDMQASLAALRMRARIEAQQRRLEVKDDPFSGLSDEAVLDLLWQEFSAMPREHLVLAVRVYCEREGLDIPMRIVTGGRIIEAG